MKTRNQSSKFYNPEDFIVNIRYGLNNVLCLIKLKNYFVKIIQNCSESNIPRYFNRN